MRRRLLLGALLPALVALLLFALPLAAVFRNLFLSDADDDLENAALQISYALDPLDVAADARDVLRHYEDREPDNQVAVAVYDAAGRRIAGDGPVRADAVTMSAGHGAPARGTLAGSLVFASAVGDAGHEVATVRAAEPEAVPEGRIREAWALMSALALVTVGVAVLVARTLARRIARPMEALVDDADRLARGEFHLQPAASGIVEVDRAARSLAGTGARLADLVDRERHLADDTSHQLRTPLAGLELALEMALTAPDGDLREALGPVVAASSRLSQTVSDLLATRPAGPAAGSGDDAATTRWTSAVDLAQAASEHWRRTGGGRPLALQVEPAAGTYRSEHALRQVLAVLLDNAAQHGSGTVVLRARTVAGGLVLDLQDDGTGVDHPLDELSRRGMSTSGGAGIGLALAQSLVRGQGGRLLLTSRTPTTFTVVLPAPSLPS